MTDERWAELRNERDAEGDLTPLAYAVGLVENALSEMAAHTVEAALRALVDERDGLRAAACCLDAVRSIVASERQEHEYRRVGGVRPVTCGPRIPLSVVQELERAMLPDNGAWTYEQFTALERELASFRARIASAPVAWAILDREGRVVGTYDHEGEPDIVLDDGDCLSAHIEPGERVVRVRLVADEEKEA
jgi:hypothetical protein